jgi:peptidoglycan/xylan/chitin deacetylase (PgdA/CDA1 family)
MMMCGSVLKSVRPLALALLLCAAAGSRSSAQPLSQGFASLERGRRDLPKVALTFDGGSGAGDTALILDTLESRDVAATFFLTGEFIRRNPELVRRIAAAGHEVGNHTWSHPHLTAWNRVRRHDTLPGVDDALVRRELASTAAAYEAVTGRRMALLWRAPYGEVNAEIAGWAGGDGWRHVGWSREDRGNETLDTLDWVADRTARNFLSPAQILARVLSFDSGGSGLNGGIVLMHLCTRQDEPLAGRLDSLIDALRGRGYALATVGELRRDLDPAVTVVALR